MTKLFFPITTILFIILNIFFLGILKTNEAGVNELFIKSEASTEEFIFESSKQGNDENRENYQKFIHNENIQNKEKSMLPLILIQLMISSFIMCFSKLDIKRGLVIFIIHFLLMGIISIFVVPYLASITNITILVLAIIIWLLANFGFKYIFTH